MALPRLSAQQPIVTTGGKPSSPFLQFMEKLREEQEDTDEGQDALLEQYASAIALINEALTLAGLAVSLAGGNAGSATSIEDITEPVWTEGPQVDLTGVVAGTLTITGTSFQTNAASRQNTAGTYSGQARIVEIDGMTETVVGGPWAFTSSRIASKPDARPDIAGPSEFSSFSAALTTTGSLSYRLDAKMDGVGIEVTDINFWVYAQRTV